MISEMASNKKNKIQEKIPKSLEEVVHSCFTD